MLAVPAQAIVISVLIHVLWGANPVAVKYSLLVFPPLWTAFFRFVIAIVCVGIWAKHLWGQGYVNPDPPVNNYYTYWTHTATAANAAYSISIPRP